MRGNGRASRWLYLGRGENDHGSLCCSDGRAVDLEWIPTAEVREGDKIACLLSDAQAYLRVTGWSDRTLDLTRYDLPVYVHRTFTVAYAPWWAAMTCGPLTCQGKR